MWTIAIVFEETACHPHLYVYHQAFHRPERIVDGQVVVQLLHQEQFVVQNNVRCFLSIAFDVGYKLWNRDVELLNLKQAKKQRSI